jgi:hypothetical protein
MRGQGRLFKRGDIFWMAYYLNDTEHRESTKRTDPKEAEKVLSDRLDERGAAKIGARNFVTAKAKRVTVRQLCEALRKKYELNGKDSPQNLSHLRRVEEDFGDYLALGLTSEVIDEYIEQRKATQRRQSTARQECSCKPTGTASRKSISQNSTFRRSRTWMNRTMCGTTFSPKRKSPR